MVISARIAFRPTNGIIAAMSVFGNGEVTNDSLRTEAYQVAELAFSLHSCSRRHSQNSTVGDRIMVRIQTGSLNADQDLEHRVMLFLKRHHRHATRDIQATAIQGLVILRGCVTSFHHRQLCVEYCKKVDGVTKVRDEIEVNERCHHRSKTKSPTKAKNSAHRPVATPRS
jgi:osmotically-inducible protein OsmY